MGGGFLQEYKGEKLSSDLERCGTGTSTHPSHQTSNSDMRRGEPQTASKQIYIAAATGQIGLKSF